MYGMFVGPIPIISCPTEGCADMDADQLPLPVDLAYLGDCWFPHQHLIIERRRNSPTKSVGVSSE